MPALKDRTGQRFGALVAQERAANSARGNTRWLCVCDCGKTSVVHADALAAGLTTSCGCGAHKAEARVRDIAGQRFGKLTAVERLQSRPGKCVLWRCRCDCGGERIADGAALRNGTTTSCGCGRITHGHTKGPKPSPTYRSWTSMVARCTQPSNPAYAYYRANGVTVCVWWMTFENFLADMGERPSLRHSIDRYPNKTGNYEPSNCRWATKREQANNRVTNRLFVYKGTEMTFAELVRTTGLPKEMLRHRLLRAGWSVEDAVTLPMYARPAA